MPSCIRCGATLDSTAKFCVMCGYPVRNNNQKASQNGGTQKSSTSQQSDVVLCIRCGKKRKLSDKLCWNCGCTNQDQIGLAGSVTASQQMWTKEQYITELNRMIGYFNKVQSWYDAHDSYIKKRNEMEKELGDYSHVRRPRHRDYDIFDRITNSFFKDTALFLWVLSESISVVVFIIFICLVTLYWPAILLIAIGCWGLCGILICVGVLLWKKGVKEVSIKREELKKVNSQISSIYKTLWSYYKNYGFCLLGFDDTNPRKI